MSEPTLVLATDLDGTFLGGEAEHRRALYRHVSSRQDVLLIFVTGRDIDFVRELIAQPDMPRPRYIIGDVGTSVFDGHTLAPVAELETQIAAAWNDAGERVKAMLAGESGIVLQDTPFRHRVSYDYDPASLSPRSVAKIEAAGFDCLLSADRFLDVLPRGISKGVTLKRLVERLAVDPDLVLVAGDTMNDLSLFQTGFKGVAVGNSEPRLAKAVQRMANVHSSRLPGAAGIADAIHHFKFKGHAIHEQVVSGHRLSPAAQ